MSDWNAQIIDEFRTNGDTTQRFGDSLVILHTVGARSGEVRLNPVMAIGQPDGSWHVAASKQGADTNPAWLANLRANPQVEIEAGSSDGVITVPVTADVLTGGDRDAAWEQFSVNPGFAAYQEKTTRVIPVVKLTRRSA